MKCIQITQRLDTIHTINLLFMVPILSNSEHKTVDFFDVVLKNDKISSSTAKNNLKMVNEKFMNMSETTNFTFVFPEALVNFTDASKGSKIFTPLLSKVKPRISAFISIVFPFEISLHKHGVKHFPLLHLMTTMVKDITDAPSHTNLANTLPK